MIPQELIDAIEAEMDEAQCRFGHFATAHEVSAVLREEFEEYWDSVKSDKPDPNELIQVAAVAIRAILQDGILRSPDSAALRL